MFKIKILKKLLIIIIIICLFFTFSFLVGFNSNNIGKQVKKVAKVFDENALGADEGEEGEGAFGIGLSKKDLINLIKEATTKHLEILERVYEKAPEVAKGAILKAMIVSIRGSNRAIEAISKGKPSDADGDSKGLKTFHIIANCNRGGIIEPKGHLLFNEGDSFTFTCIADDEYVLLWLRVDNEKLEGETSYTFDDIDSNHTIHAHFRKIKDSANGNGD